MEDRTTRREFLKKAAAGGAAIAGVPGIIAAGRAASAIAAGAAPRNKARIVVARNPAMLDGDDANPVAVAQALSKAMSALTGQKSVQAAWKSLFRPEDVVGIKVNCLFGRTVSTRPEVVSAVVAGLKLAGVRPDNIIVWDRSTADLAKSGFVGGRSSSGAVYFANDGEWGEEVRNGSFHGRLTKVFDRITALINMPVVKHHQITGVTCALKNHYGSFHNPGDHHGNNGDPYLADLNAIPQIKDKTRLIVADALKPQYDGGPGRAPGAQWEYYTLIVGTDPVAVDYHAFEIIDARRKEAGIASIAGQTKWLASAAQRGVGTSDPARIEIVRV